MSYLVLARKWRPRRFSEVVGQEPVVRALVNGLKSKRLHHAFLLTGTRGIGKTTIARILAKSLNCEQGTTAEPCCECEICQAVDDGRFFDLIEVDAASRTGVDDMRELLDNVQYAPARGRCKVYLIDEVHMLSNSSFNALLKTLEEPPPHVKFILATTDPQKLPPTVLSRCLQFHLKRLTQAQLVGQLEHILAAESIEADSISVARIARSADGSMRDALSLLDQAIAHGGGSLNGEQVGQMLGTVDGSQALALLDAVVRDDVKAVLQQIDDLAIHTPNFGSLLEEIALFLHRMAFIQVAEAAVENDTQLAEMAKKIGSETIQLFYEIAIRGRRDLNLAPDPRVGAEMTLLRMMAFRPEMGRSDKSMPVKEKREATVNRPRDGAILKARIPPEGTANAAPPAPVPEQKSSVNRECPPMTRSAGTELSSQNEIKEPQPVGARRISAPQHPLDPEAWEAVIAEMGLVGPVRMLGRHCSGLFLSETGWQLSLVQASKAMLNDMVQQRLEDALNDHFGVQHRLRISLGSESLDTPDSRREKRDDDARELAEQALAKDPVARDMQAQLGASVLENATRPS